jgi:hypothetical protein
MTGLSLVVLTLLFAASLASWHPDISARLEREPWWLVAGAPAAALGLAAALMVGGSGGVDGWVRGTVFVLTVGVSVAGGRTVTLAFLRGAERSGVPHVLHPTDSPRLAAGNGQTGVPASTASSTTRHDGPATVPLGVHPAPSSTTPEQETVHVTGTARDGETVLKGGTWIGALERAAVTASLLTGLTEGIVVVLAVKGLGRYPELRAPGAAERFIIGTFTSLLWAASAAGVGLLAG